MAEFEYRFVKATTGRVNKGRVGAYDEEEARAILLSRGITVSEIEKLPPDLATERQLDFLRDLGGVAPPGTTKREASDLIDNAQFKRIPAPPALRPIATRYRVEITQYTSKENLYRAVVSTLRANRDLKALAEWYAFRVYRSGCQRQASGVLVLPSDPRFAEVAEEILADVSLVASLQREAERTSTGFRWFGQYRGNQGDSDRTAVFRFTATALASKALPGFGGGRSNGRASSKPLENNATLERDPQLSRNSGCLVVLVAGFALAGALALGSVFA